MDFFTEFVTFVHAELLNYCAQKVVPAASTAAYKCSRPLHSEVYTGACTLRTCHAISLTQNNIKIKSVFYSDAADLSECFLVDASTRRLRCFKSIKRINGNKRRVMRTQG